MAKESYLIPENLDLPSLLDEGGLFHFNKPIVLDKFFYVIDNLYLRYVLHGEKWDKFQPINCATLRRVINHRFATKVMEELVRLGILERSKKKYSSGYFSQSFRFAEKYRVKFRAIPASDEKQAKRIIKRREEASICATESDPALALIRKSILEVDFDCGSASKLVALNDYSIPFLEDYEWDGYEAKAIKEFNRILKRKVVIDAFRNKDFSFSRDRFGRFHHILTNCARELRPFATWQGKPLFNIDVSCYHPALASLLYDEECEEKERYAELVKNNRIYEFIRDESGIEVDFDDPEAKKQFKQTTFNKVYYGSNYATPCPVELAVMKEHFPILVCRLQKEKVRHQKYVAHKIQKWESTVILDHVAGQFALNHLGEDVCLISIHDALVTTEEYVHEIMALMEETFRQVLGFPLTVKCSLLSGNWDGTQLSDPASEFVSTGARMECPAIESAPIRPEEMGISSISPESEGATVSARCTDSDYLELDDLEEGEDPF